MNRENLIEKYTMYGEADVHIPGTEYVICSEVVWPSAFRVMLQ